MLYLELYHGRKNPGQDMEEGFGFEGPLIGPLKVGILTYLHILRIQFKSDTAAQRCGFNTAELNWLNIHDDMVLFQGNYYGDFSFIDLTKEEIAERKQWEGRVHAIPYKKYAKLVGSNSSTTTK